jgi:Zn-finger nucleic acid-binding protein
MTERQGVEIDYCPQCRGVWLDRGELDKIIDRSADVTPAQAGTPEPRYQESRDSGRRYPDQQHYKKKRKESFLGDLFDF